MPLQVKSMALVWSHVNVDRKDKYLSH